MTYILDKILVNFLAKPGHPNEKIQELFVLLDDSKVNSGKKQNEK